MVIEDYIFKFKREKAVESIRYITSKLGFLDAYAIGHLMFIAELFHLQEYGRPVFGDRYVALKNGALALGAFSIPRDLIAGNSIILGFMVGNNFSVKTSKDPNLEVLSESDINVLSWVCKFYEDNPENWVNMCKTEVWQELMDEPQAGNVLKFKLLNFKKCVLSLKDGEDIWNYVSDGSFS